MGPGIPPESDIRRFPLLAGGLKRLVRAGGIPNSSGSSIQHRGASTSWIRGGMDGVPSDDYGGCIRAYLRVNLAGGSDRGGGVFGVILNYLRWGVGAVADSIRPLGAVSTMMLLLRG